MANLKCRLPKSERKIKDETGKEIGDCCFRVDIDGAPAGHNKFIFAAETTDDLIRAYSSAVAICIQQLCMRLIACWCACSVDGGA